ncbi:hypothetical protein OKN36_04000 [Furfurilactobacillus sp. OKN36]
MALFFSIRGGALPGACIYAFGAVSWGIQVNKSFGFLSWEVSGQGGLCGATITTMHNSGVLNRFVRYKSVFSRIVFR